MRLTVFGQTWSFSVIIIIVSTQIAKLNENLSFNDNYFLVCCNYCLVDIHKINNFEKQFMEWVELTTFF